MRACRDERFTSTEISFRADEDLESILAGSRVPKMEAVHARDLFLHRVLMAPEGDPAQPWLVFIAKRAREQTDDYEQVLWGMRPGRDESPRPLTSPVFTAASPKLHPR